MDNSTPGTSALLVQYLDGELLGADKNMIEEKLSTDTSLQQEFENLLLTRESIRHYGLHAKVATIHQQMVKELRPAPRSILPKKFFRYVASVAASILLIVGGYLAYSFFNLSSEKVYSANYQTYELSTTRSNSNEVTAIEEAYRKKEYKEVIRLQEANNNNSAQSLLLAGMAAMELNDNTKAIKHFKEVLAVNKKAGSKTFNDEAEYYLAISYVRNKDYDAALELMNTIKEDAAHTYNKKITGKLIRQVKLLKWR